MHMICYFGVLARASTRYKYYEYTHETHTHVYILATRVCWMYQVIPFYCQCTSNLGWRINEGCWIVWYPVNRGIMSFSCIFMSWPYFRPYATTRTLFVCLTLTPVQNRHLSLSPDSGATCMIPGIVLATGTSMIVVCSYCMMAWWRMNAWTLRNQILGLMIYTVVQWRTLQSYSMSNARRDMHISYYHTCRGPFYA